MSSWQSARPTQAPHTQIGMHKSQDRLAELEARLEALENVVQIANDGSVTIKANGKVRIQSARELEVAGLRILLDASAGMALKSSGTMNIQGVITKINAGSRPVAAIGDTTNGAPGSGTGVISKTLNTTVLV